MAEYFGPMNGITMMSVTFGSIFGPLVVGRAVDVTGEYTVGWLVSAGVVALAIFLLWAARPQADLMRGTGSRWRRRTLASRKSH